MRECEWCGTSFVPPLRYAEVMRFCSVKCGNRWMSYRKWGNYNHEAALLPRFEAKFLPEPNSGCWLWIGALVPDGYGSFGISTDKTIKAHRMAWILYHGPIPDEAHVLHKCDTRCCVNPDHLFLGDNASNRADCVAKKRQFRKLSDTDIRSIAADTRPQHIIALDYGVRQATISRAKQRADCVIS